MEDQLLTELFLTFPGGDLSLTCVGCGQECGSDYVKKEHILLSHPWPSLKAEVDETLSECERTEAGNVASMEGLKMDFVEQIERTQENQEKDINEDVVGEIECQLCGTTLGDSESARIHIGEVHLEVELNSELLRIFPEGRSSCKECDEETKSEYQKKEHILIEHPWSQLKALMINRNGDNENTDLKEHDDAKSVHEASEEENTKMSKADKGTDDLKENVNVSEKHEVEKWYSVVNYSCNYCEKIFAEMQSAKRHINVVHNIDLSKGYAKHLYDARKRYSCKICKKQCEHSRRAITRHLTSHNMRFEEYERKYEKNHQAVNKPAADPKDVLDEVLDDTLNELCEPEKELRDDTRKRKPSGGSQNASKHRKTTFEKAKIENRIEFSDSSDDED